MQLTNGSAEYDCITQYGHKNIGAWIEAMARAVDDKHCLLTLEIEAVIADGNTPFLTETCSMSMPLEKD